MEYEQGGKEQAAYGTELLKQLPRDLQARLGPGFSERNLEQMRQFYLQWQISQTLSADSATEQSQAISQTASAKLKLRDPPKFPLSWSHYVHLLSVADLKARQHYESEALRGGGPFANSTARFLPSPINAETRSQPKVSLLGILPTPRSKIHLSLSSLASRTNTPKRSWKKPLSELCPRAYPPHRTYPVH